MADTSKTAIVETVMAYKGEADSARTKRMRKNKLNYEMYHLEQDWGHKLKNQSQEFLPRQSMAVEQISQFLHQGIIDLGEFFSAEPKPAIKNPLFSKDEARKLIADQLSKAEFYTHVHDALKAALLGSLMISKVHGCKVPQPRFFSRKNPRSGETKLYRSKNLNWQAKIELVRQKDYFPDPTAEKLYEVQRIEKDMWEVLEMAKAYPEAFDSEAVARLSAGKSTGTSEDHDKAREQNQNIPSSSFRKRVELHECWGKILDCQTGKVLHERAVCVVANGTELIMPPMPYPTWDNESPFVVDPLIRVPWSVWHRALMDAPTELNKSLNEIFNLIIDGGINSVFGIKQLREYWLEDPSQVNDGIVPGTTLGVNQSCPPNAKVLERVDTGSLSSEGMTAFDMASREFNMSSLTNDLRLGGMPNRAVKATEVVEASNSITSVFTGVGKCLEGHIEKVITKVWNGTQQNFDDLNPEDLKAILGERRAKVISEIEPKERFAKTVNGHQFRVFGVTQTMNKIKDFRKLTGMLQTIAGDPTLKEAFAREYDFTKLLQQIMQSLDVDIDSIKLDQADREMNAMGAADEQGGGAPEGGPDMQSQIPQAMAGGEEQLESAMPQTEFPNG